MTLTAIRKSAKKYPKLRDLAIRLAWLAVVMPSIVFSLTASIRHLSLYQLAIERWVYVYLNFGSFVVGVIAALIIFWRKPKDWLAITVSLMLVTWTSTSTGSDFWVATGIGGSTLNPFIAYFLSLPYTLLLSMLLLLVLLTFPNSQWTPNWTRWLYIASLLGTFLLPVYLCGMLFFQQYVQMPQSISSLLLDILPEVFRLGVLVLGALMQVYRFLTTRDPFQRQQLKWIALSLVGMTLFYVLYNIFALTSLGANTDSLLMLTLFLFTLIFTYGFIITFAISVLRYRIWDIDIVINRTLVYSGLTAILGSLGIAGSVLFDYYAKMYLDESASVVGLFVVMPMVVLFAPLRDALQSFVDRRFKPEEIDFSGTIVEFSPEAQLMLSSNDIMKILARQIREQLNVDDVQIFLKYENGELYLCEPLPDEGDVPCLRVPSRERAVLESGNAVVPTEGAYSLLLSLVLRRASRPEFLGVIALGKREQNLGYSSLVIRSLQRFGADVGKVLYVAKLRESRGRTIMERLASIEKGLANLKTNLA